MTDEGSKRKFVKQAEDVTMVLLFNYLFFLLCVYSVTAHEQEDERSLQRYEGRRRTGKKS